MNGALALVQELKRRGIDLVCGLPGTQNIALFDALRLSGLKTVVATSELNAAFIANGYFRACGKPAALITIPGPGFTAALTGIAEASHDSVSLLYICVAPRRSCACSYPLQALPQLEMIMPITRRSIQVTSSSQLYTALDDAFSTLYSGEPGPVYLEVDAAILSEPAQPRTVETAHALPVTGLDDGRIQDVARRLEGAERPILILGAGAISAHQQISALLKQLPAAVITSTSARGIVDENLTTAICADIGMARIDHLNYALARGDLILSLGIKFSHNGSQGGALQIDPERHIRVDRSAEVLSRNYPASCSFCDEATPILSALNACLKSSNSKWSEHELAELRTSLLPVQPPFPPRIVERPASEFFAGLNKLIPDPHFIVTDSGMHQMLCRHYLRFSAARFIAPTDFQSMGFGLPAAIGANIASQRHVLAILGDGGFLMSASELATAVHTGCWLTAFVFCDGKYGLISNQQLLNFGHDFAVELPPVDLEKFAASCGARFFNYEEMSEGFVSALREPVGVTIVRVPLCADSALLRAALKTQRRRRLKQIVGERVVSKIRRIFSPL